MKLVLMLRVEDGQDSLPYHGPVARGGVASGNEAAQPGGGDNQFVLRQLKQDGKNILYRQTVNGGVISGYPCHDEIGGGRAAYGHEVTIVRGENAQLGQGRRKPIRG